MPQPRQLSAYDPEWEEDPHFLAASRKTATLQAQSKTLPSPAVLRDILSELTERQRSEEREAAAAAAPAASDEPTHLRYLGTSTSMTFEGEVRPSTPPRTARCCFVPPADAQLGGGFADGRGAGGR
eukprot:COSAG06_NODE_16514_length_997_cov_0.974388_1_plen_126_part_00